MKIQCARRDNIIGSGGKIDAPAATIYAKRRSVYPVSTWITATTYCDHESSGSDGDASINYADIIVSSNVVDVPGRTSPWSAQIITLNFNEEVGVVEKHCKYNGEKNAGTEIK